MKILVTPTSFCKNKAMLASLSEKAELVVNQTGRPLTEEELIPMVADIDGYLAGLDFITAKVLENAPKLKVVSRYGVGFERVDIEAAGKHGIKVTNTPGANSQSVADLAFGLMLSCARKIPAFNRSMKEGGWDRANGKELYGKTMGIIGFGAIGRGIAARARGFSMKILAYDPYVNPASITDPDIKITDLDSVIAGADVITLHVPHTPETHNLINAARIAGMKDGVIIINTSRGGLLDEDAVLDGMNSGKIWGVGLDAFESEPPAPHKLYENENVIMTPHAGAHTVEAVDNMTRMSVENLFGILDGRDGFERFVVNKKFLL